MKPDYATFYIVRHGETVSNVNHLVEGHLDSPITEAGELGIKEVAKKLAGVHFDAVFSSDSPRAVKTAQILIEGRDMAIVQTNLLRERNFGIFEGKTRAEYAEINKELIALARSLAREDRRELRFHETMEIRQEMEKRLFSFFADVAPRFLGKTVLVATHGGIFITIMHYLGDEADYHISNGAIIVLESDGQEIRMRSMEGIIPRGEKKK